MSKKNLYFLSILHLFILQKLEAQVFTGTVKEDTKEKYTIPYANILIKGKSIGTVSDGNGKFNLAYTNHLKKTDSIVFSFLGYQNKTISLFDFKNNSIVYLKTNVESLNEVVVSADLSSYDSYLMNQIIAHKKSNNPHSIKKIHFDEISFLSVFLANLDSTFTEKRIFKTNKKDFIKKTDSTFALPIYFSKEILNHQIDRDENIETNQIVKSEQEGALEQLNSTIKTFVNYRITQNINFYDENIELLGRGFKSPIASDYKTYYNVYLSDSTLIKDVKHYKFEYYPKNEKSVAFDGSFWVESETFALTKIDADLPDVANVNFIKNLGFELTYQKVKGNNWAVKTQKTKTEFSLTNSSDKKSKYFLIQKNQNYTNFELNPTKKTATAKSLH